MMRQCAWCLRLIDSRGERVSQLPLPKLYEASHGMCDVCGAQWLQQMLGPSAAQNTPPEMPNHASKTGEYLSLPAEYIEKPSRTTTRLARELGQQEPETSTASIHTK
jgi:hypothetical protein